MAQLATGIVGATVGFMIGGPVGAQIGWMAGVVAGGVLFPPRDSNQTVEGPRLEDRSVQISTYGIALARIYGTIRVSGNVIWATELKETRHETTTTSGGKGGGGGQTTTQITYTYSSSFAVSLCETQITGIRRIWADGKLIYDVSDTNTNGATQKFDAASFAQYFGTETQMPDPTIVAHLGANVPAYRGQAYVVFTDLQLADYGNRIPNLSFEITNGTNSFQSRVVIDELPVSFYHEDMICDPNTGRIWAFGGDPDYIINTRTIMYCIDPFSNSVVATTTIPHSDGKSFNGVCHMSSKNQIWAWVTGGSGDDELWKFDSGSGVFVEKKVIAGWARFLGYGLYENKATGNALAYCGSWDTPGGYDWWKSVEVDADGAVTQSFSTDEDRRDGVVVMVPEFGKMLMFTSHGYMQCRAMSDYSLLWEVNNGWSKFPYPETWTVDTIRGRIFVLGDTTEDYDGFVYDLNSGALLTANIDLQSMFTGTFPYTVHYNQFTDRYYVGSYFIGDDNRWHIVVLNAADYTQVDDMAYDGEVASTVKRFFENSVFFDRLYFMGGDDPGFLGYVPMRQSITASSYPLADVIKAESALVGIPESMINVDLIDEEVLGYAISRTVPVRTVIEQLMLVYRFDAVDSGGVMKFVPRKYTLSTTLDSDYLAAHEMGTEAPELLPITRRDETELPMIVITKYLDRDRDYEVSAQAAARMTGFSLNERTQDLPMVLTAAQAKAVAEVGLYSAWATRTTAEIKTTIKYQKIEPTDVVVVEGNTMRVLGKELLGNRITLRGEWENNEVYTQEAVVPESEFVPQSISYSAGTQLALMDIVALRDSDSNTGFYIAAKGYGTGWPGCVVYKSTDGGSSYTEMAVITEPSPIGILLDPLPATSDGLFDYSNPVRVSVGDAALETVTELAVLNGANVMCVGTEVIQYRVAIERDPGIYSLTGILRGRRGSPIVAHTAGEQVVGLSSTTTQRILMDAAEVGLSRTYRVVTIGRPLSTGSDYIFTNTANALECLSPVHVGMGINSSSDIEIHWTRRSRLGGHWTDYIDVPLSEVTESYALEIYDGINLVRTINTSTQTCNYSAAQQTSDFGAAQTSLSIKLWQVSATNGPGFLFEGTI